MRNRQVLEKSMTGGRAGAGPAGAADAVFLALPPA